MVNSQYIPICVALPKRFIPVSNDAVYTSIYAITTRRRLNSINFIACLQYIDGHGALEGNNILINMTSKKNGDSVTHHMSAKDND